MQQQMSGGNTTPTATTTPTAANANANAVPVPSQQTEDAAAAAATEAAAAAATEAAAAAAVGAFEVSEEMMSERGFGGNRWPRQETLALLKIRSDMGIAFRDASVKGPLWEEVSRKMAELGYIRNAKKCKEKFENVYKYHKRTKEGRTGKSEGKTYRFFDQLEALESQSTNSSHHHHHQPQSQPLQTPPQPRPHNNNNNNSVFSTPPPVTTIMPPTTTIALPSSSVPPYTQAVNIPSFPNISGDFMSDNSTSSSSSYSTSSDVEVGGANTTSRKKRKRKWKEFFERLMKQVVDKQEELQHKFLEAVEKRERERLAREEAWRGQEIARINREHEILTQERSMSAAKDAAVMAFLQKLSEKPNAQGQTVAQPQQPQQPQPQQPRPQMQLNNNNNNNQQMPQQQTPQTPIPQPSQPVVPASDATKTDNGEQNMTTPVSATMTAVSTGSGAGMGAGASSSRWPKVEIEALIKLRTNLDSKYQENGPKGPLWEEISAGMRRLGFNRNSKRCKEKWENINKYFKKVKESNKKRPEDSKTCPYFHQLDALYRERNKFHHHHNNNNNIASSSSVLAKPDNSVPLMVQPEQQWPPATGTTTMTTVTTVAQGDQAPPAAASQPLDQNFDDDEGTDEEDYDDEDEDEENEEEEGGEFEVVPSNNNNNTNNNGNK